MEICQTDRLPFKLAIQTPQFQGCRLYVGIQLCCALQISAFWPKQKAVLTNCMVPILSNIQAHAV